MVPGRLYNGEQVTNSKLKSARPDPDAVRIIPIGGLGEFGIGKNNADKQPFINNNQKRVAQSVTRFFVGKYFSLVMVVCGSFIVYLYQICTET